MRQSLLPLAYVHATPISFTILSKLKLALHALKLARNVLVRMTTSALNVTLIQIFPRLINASAIQDTSKIPLILLIA